MTIENILYGGKVRLVFESFRHSYTIYDPENGVDGDRAMSVTGALKIIDKSGVLINWAVRLCADTIQEQIVPGQAYDELQLDAIITAGRKAHFENKVNAGNIGSTIHKWIENYIKGNNPSVPVSPTLQEPIKKFLAWVEKYKVEFLISEQLIYSRQYKYAGTLDFICKIGGHLFLGDLKTSSGVYPEYMIQTATYRMAREEEFPAEKYSGQLILRLGKDGSVDFAVMPHDEVWYAKMKMAFVCAMKLSQLMDDIKANYKPRYLK